MTSSLILYSVQTILCALGWFSEALMIGLLFLVVMLAVFCYGFRAFTKVTNSLGRSTATGLRMKKLNVLMLKFVVLMIILLALIATCTYSLLPEKRLKATR